jgi:hypothetical protein
MRNIRPRAPSSTPLALAILAVLSASTPTRLAGQGFAPSGTALCYVDGVINVNAQACTTYLLGRGLLGGVIEDNYPSDITTDLFANPAGGTQPAITWLLGVGRGGTTPSSTNPTAWILEVPLILPDASHIIGKGVVGWNADTSIGSLLMTGSSFPGYLTNGSISAQIQATATYASPTTTLTTLGGQLFPAFFGSGANIIVTGCSVLGDDGSFVIASGGSGTTQLTYTGGASGTNVSGCLVSPAPSVTVAGTTVTLSLSANWTPQFTVGSPLVVTGCSVAADNGLFTIASGGAGSNNLTYTDTTLGIGAATGCIAYIGFSAAGLGAVTCQASGGTIQAGTYFVQVVEENNLQGANSLVTTVPGPTTASNERSVSCTGINDNSIVVPSPVALVNPNKAAIGNSSVFDAKDYAVCASAVSGEEICGCTVKTAGAVCTATPVITCTVSLGSVDHDAGCALGGGATITAIPEIPRATTSPNPGTGAFAPPLADLSSVAIVIGDSNSTHVGSDNSFNQELRSFAIECGPVAYNSAISVATPSVAIWNRSGQEALQIDKIGYQGGCPGANFYITRGNSMYTNLLPSSNNLYQGNALPPTQFFNLVADSMYFNALSNVNLYASSFNNGGTGNANVYIRGTNAFLNEFGIHHENPGNGGGDNVRCDWSANCSIFGGIGDDRGVSGVGQAHRCAQSSSNPFFATTGVQASESGQTVTFTLPVGINWGPSFQNHTGNGSAIVAEGCSVAGYNGIISQILTGGVGTNTMTAFNPNTVLSNATTCTLTSLDCLGNAGTVSVFNYSPQGGGVTLVQDDLRNLTLTTLSANNPAIPGTYDSQNYIAKNFLIGTQTITGNAGLATIGASGTGNTPFTFGVEPSKNYKLVCDINFLPSVTTAGMQLQVTGPSGATVENNLSWIPTSALTSPVPYSSGFSAVVSQGTAVTAANQSAHFVEYIQTGILDGGSIAVQDAPQTTGTITLTNLPGTECELIAENQLP